MKNLPNLRNLRPDRYEVLKHTYTGESILTFAVKDNQDYDWLEEKIHAEGYYEQDHIWSKKIDLDKRILADIVSAFIPENFLEIGCSVGAVIHCLREMGFRGLGLEISDLMLSRAIKDTLPFIRKVDLLEYVPAEPHDVVCTFDLLEHLNPNKIDAYIEKIDGALNGAGSVIVNAPTYGTDEVFGSICEPYLAPWQRMAYTGKNFDCLQVDEIGWPIHGHLIFAGSSYWVDLFARHGFRRESEVERALHQRFDDFFTEVEPARRSLYIFSKGQSDQQIKELIARIKTGKFPGLQRFRLKWALKGIASRLGILAVRDYIKNRSQ